MAANHAVLFGWNRVVPGSEQKALVLFQEAVGFWGQQQQAGNIESFEPFFLSPHGGDLNGFILVRGQPDKLNQILASDEYITIELRATLLLEGHGVIRAICGEEITRQMGIYQQLISA